LLETGRRSDGTVKNRENRRDGKVSVVPSEASRSEAQSRDLVSTIEDVVSGEKVPRLRCASLGTTGRRHDEKVGNSRKVPMASASEASHGGGKFRRGH
jgi:hypothetical protein